jgi:predicted dehydrogenase
VRPDVVHVSPPPSAHVDAARAALNAGAHVYVEKPFALRTADARSLLDAAVRRSLDVREGGAPGLLMMFPWQTMRTPGLL